MSMSQEIDEAIEFAKSSAVPEASDLYTHVYSDPKVGFYTTITQSEKSKGK